MHEGYLMMPKTLSYFSLGTLFSPAPLFSAFGGWSFGATSKQRKSRGNSNMLYSAAVVVSVLILLAVAGLCCMGLAPGITSCAGLAGCSNSSGSGAIAVSGSGSTLVCAAPWLAQLKAAAATAATGALSCFSALQAVMPSTSISMTCAAPPPSTSSSHRWPEH
jgi:hypothetical protein